MKKFLICILIILGIFVDVCGQAQENCIRKIAKDFLVSREMLSEKAELNSISLIVYDYVNKIDITNDEPLPKQNELVFYNFRVLSPHSLGYVLLVKNGVYEIIDMNKNLEDILKQICSYSCKNGVKDNELFEILTNILFQYNANIQDSGGVPIRKE